MMNNKFNITLQNPYRPLPPATKEAFSYVSCPQGSELKLRPTNNEIMTPNHYNALSDSS